MYATWYKKLPEWKTHGQLWVLTKIPDCTDTFVVVLIVVVLVAIVEILFPGVVRTVLRRTPIVVVRKATNKLNKGVNARIVTLVSLVVINPLPLSLFIQNHAHSPPPWQ